MEAVPKTCRQPKQLETLLSKEAIWFGRQLKDGYANAIEEDKVRATEAWHAEHKLMLAD